jgi:proteasome assembly chaperone (PAC2) family protein
MEKENDVWIEPHKRIESVAPVAIVGSPGLRSIGKLVVDSLIAEMRAQLIAQLYSTHLPSIYQTAPSYAANPLYPGVGGALVSSARADLPSIQFYSCSVPELILVVGYHPNFEGHYDIAETVLRLLSEHHVKRMIVVAGYGSPVKNVVCAANSCSIISEMKEKFNIGVGYEGPFMGFSGLVFGLAERKNIEALCLFAATTPTEDDLEFPDNEASERVLEKLRTMLKLR